MTIKPSRPPHVSPYDGRHRSPELEQEINEAFAYCFRGKTGEIVLDYLQSITTQKILVPPIDANTLIHLEGQRSLYGVIRKRVTDGQSKRKAK
jgi:hypothetical protein